MSATCPDGVATPHPDPTPSGRKRPVAIPWREIACRLAEGARPAAVAADLGLREEQIWRHLRRSLRFRFYLRQAMERQRLLAGLQLATLGPAALLSRGLNPDSLDGDLLRLLNEAGHGHEPGAELAKQIEQLGKTGERPPNMALHRRLIAKIEAQNAQFAAFRAQDAAMAAALRARTSEGNESPRTGTNLNEPVRTATNPDEPPRTAANPGEPARTVTNPNEPQRVPRPRPPSPPPEPPRPAIVDLDGPDLRRLRAAGLLGGGERRQED